MSEIEKNVDELLENIASGWRSWFARCLDATIWRLFLHQ
jgi:hypothetical protein